MTEQSAGAPPEIAWQLNRILEAGSIEEVWALHSAHMAAHGFDRLLYGSTRGFIHEEDFGDPDDILALSTHDKAYTDFYIGQGMFRESAVLRKLRRDGGACSWSWLNEQHAAGRLSPEEERLYQIKTDAGVIAGYSISFHDLTYRTRAAIGLCAKPGITQAEVDAYWAAHGEALLLCNRVMHLRISQLPYCGNRRPLTSRQREALEWVAGGKTTQDIAAIMGVTPATVEKHLRLARESLDADTTAQAVMKASVSNQIFTRLSSAG